MTTRVAWQKVVTRQMPHGMGDLQRQRVLALLEACQALSSSLVLEEVMDLISRGVDKAFGLTSVDIYEYHADRDAIEAVRVYMPSRPEEGAAFVGTVYSLDEHPNFRRAFARRSVVEYHLDDQRFRREDPALYAEMSQWGERSIIEVGLFFGDEVMGLLSIGSTEHPVHLDDEEKELLIAFAATAAIAIHNAKLYRTIEEQAVRDGLTGLFNHRHFYERLESELVRIRRYGTPVSLLMLDVDDFKRFNDRFGHRAGDEVLCAVADAVARDLRRDLDVPCRYGGEEFAVILPNTPPADAPHSAAEVAERLRRRVAALRVHDADGRELDPVTVSVGVAVYPNERCAAKTAHGDSGSADGLVTVADEALYVAKARGKDRVEVAPGYAAPGEAPQGTERP